MTNETNSKDTDHNIVWFEKVEQPGWPTFREEVFTGDLNKALDYVIELAKGARFMMGQVLAKDGKVLATVAPQGISRISSE